MRAEWLHCFNLAFPLIKTVADIPCRCLLCRKLHFLAVFSGIIGEIEADNGK